MYFGPSLLTYETRIKESEKSIRKNTVSLVTDSLGNTFSKIMALGCSGIMEYGMYSNIDFSNPSEVLAFGVATVLNIAVAGAATYAIDDSYSSSMVDTKSTIKTKKEYRDAVKSGDATLVEKLESEHDYLAEWGENFLAEKATQYTLDFKN